MSLSSRPHRIYLKFGARLSDYFALTKTRNGLGQLNITKVCSISQFVCHPRSQISATWSQISSTQILLIADSWYHARPCLFPKNLIFKTANILIFNKFPSSAIEVPITGAAKKIIDVVPIFLLQQHSTVSLLHLLIPWCWGTSEVSSWYSCFLQSEIPPRFQIASVLSVIDAYYVTPHPTSCHRPFILSPL